MFTLGPLIHNPQVVDGLAAQGVHSVSSLDDVPPGSIIIMPSHGVPNQVRDQAKSSGLEIIDVTCPFVAKVHTLAERLVNQNYQVVVLGDKGHTEVRGIMCVAGEDAVAVSDIEELDGTKLQRRVGIVAQTTQTVEKYSRLVGKVSEHAYEVRAYNTICDATLERQEAALEATSEVDVMLVVGGRNSANTRRLYEICSESGTRTFHVEVAEEVEDSWFDGAQRVGITAGASTPDWIIQGVAERVSEISAAVSANG
jgi:4-hydroxy-3-methylbut-2-enyl diphosphate reductase